MFLDKLQIVGFKSFAKRTSFQFNRGITGIVGPNGCGKSNIVDAIRWVLGEQKAGTLRSERMENVIFNGSKQLKPLGMAEVSMNIKNTKNLLPIEYTEVVITRRLFRSGESQYLLNNNICRLKDILNLFMDSGIGFDAYSVIELKMVESILNGRPEERRRIFEEAAGVTKYKQRRLAAFRKLENTEKDLLRMRDIITEVQKNVESLERQVRKAQRYENLLAELKELELKTATYQFSTILDELDPIIDNFEKFQKDQEKIIAKLNLYEADVETLRTQQIQIEQKLTGAQQRLNEVNTRIQKRESTIALNQERIKAIDESNQRDEFEANDLGQRRERLKSDSITLEKTSVELKEKIKTDKTYYEEKNLTLQENEKQLLTKRSQVKNHEQEHIQKIEAISNLSKNQERLKVQLEHQHGRLTGLKLEETALKQDNEHVQKDISEKEKNNLQNTEDFQRKANEREMLDEQISELTSKTEELKEEIFNDRNNVQHLENRIQLLRQLRESLEDYPEGVRYLMLEKGKKKGYIGALADLISVPEEYRLAIEVLLGELSVSLLTDSATQALDGISDLQKTKKGIVSFFPLENSVLSLDGESGNKILNSPEIISRADQIISIDSKYQKILTGLFSRCYIVKDFQTAQSLAQQNSNQILNFVTLAGELVSTTGMIKGGLRSEKQTGQVGRGDELLKFENQYEELLTKIQQKERERELINLEIERLNANRTLLVKQIQGIEQEKTKFQITLGQLNYRQSQNTERLSRIHDEQVRIQAEMTLFDQELTNASPEIELLTSQKSELETHLVEMRSQLTEFEQQYDTIAKEVHHLNLNLVEIEGKFANIARELNQNELRIAEYSRTIENKTTNIQRGKEQKVVLQKEIEQYDRELESDFVVQEELENVVQKFETERSDISRKTEDMSRFLKGLYHDRDQTSERIHNLELQISQNKLKAENIQQRIREEFDLIIQREAVPPGIALDEMQNDLEQARKRLKTIGPVNLVAIEEYNKEKERFDFLNTQQNDLIEARDTLNKTIELINETAQKQFAEIYETIRNNFKNVFHNFFPNGEADLIMSESGDVLENEIEVVANAKGKRLGSLALLSGGEKTLTAISLLFAIYLVKPSPFCILDEVDAPLDDMNINRFNQAIKNFSDNTQFIIVTHNKLTMKAADSLYGITMSGDGASKVVSVKIEQES